MSIMQKLAISRAQGRPQLFNATSQTVHFQYMNDSTKELKEIWYDNATTLKTKYEWAVKDGIGMQGVGMWTAGATRFDEQSLVDLWGAIPTGRGQADGSGNE